MALVNHNATLEYATNTLEFWLTDDAGAPENFTIPLTFNVKRADSSEVAQSFVCTVNGNQATVVVTPTKIPLYVDGDSIYDYDNPEYNHLFSLKSNTQVYMSGKVNLVEVAG